MEPSWLFSTSSLAGRCPAGASSRNILRNKPGPPQIEAKQEVFQARTNQSRSGNVCGSRAADGPPLTFKSTTRVSLHPHRGCAPRQYSDALRKAEVARLYAGAREGGTGTRSLTSGGSLKRLSRNRPRLNSISRAEPLATVTRLRWFRENMLAALRLYLPCELTELLASVSCPLFSLEVGRLPPSAAGISSCLVPKLLPRRGHLGWAGRGTLLSSPCPSSQKGPGRQESPADSPRAEGTLHLQSTAWAHPPFQPGGSRLTWT